LPAAARHHAAGTNRHLEIPGHRSDLVAVISRTVPLRRTTLFLPLAAFTIAACDTTPRAKSTTLESQPHAADYYAKLYQRQLTEADPVPTQQALTCEVGRLERALGQAEAAIRVRGANDTIVLTPAEQKNSQRVAGLVGNRQYWADGPVCDALNKVADREVPLTRTAAAATPGTPPPTASTPPAKPPAP
jgi:hypothetical protein